MIVVSIFPKAMHVRFVWLALAVAVLASNSPSQSQTVSANFGNRSVSTPVVPSGIFSVDGTGSTITDQGTISTLTSAGLSGTRFWIPLQQIYANSTANFNYLDKTLETMKDAGLHPLGVIYNTPPSLGSTPCAPPSDVWKWGQLAASVVAHVDQKFPGLMQDYEIWNEPELATSLCVADATSRRNSYIALFAAAAAAMHAQAESDGETIRTGGPVISQLSQAPTWIPALLSNTSAAPYVDFVSFHLYITGLTNIQNGMNWSQLYAITQSSTQGLAYYYKKIEPLVRSGHQPNATSTPIYITEYNDNWAYALDCCRNDPTYAPLWNSVAITDFLNVVYSGASAVPSQLGYFNSAGSYFCIMGEWNSSMNCDSSVLEPYPQFYAYKLFASPDYLDLQAGGHMAVSVSPASTTTGLAATAFYTNSADSVVIVNPTSTSYSAVNIVLTNPGLPSATAGTIFLLDRSNGQISTQSVSLKSISGGYSATVEVPAYATVALSVKAGQSGSATSAPTTVIAVTPQSGTHPLVVDVDSSHSQGGGSAIIGRTIDFGDGSWLNWWPSASHAYARAGNYKIQVTVKNQSGQLSTATTTITVH
jgi:PKD repeat protein